MGSLPALLRSCCVGVKREPPHRAGSWSLALLPTLENSQSFTKSAFLLCSGFWRVCIQFHHALCWVVVPCSSNTWEKQCWTPYLEGVCPWGPWTGGWGGHLASPWDFVPWDKRAMYCKAAGWWLKGLDGLTSTNSSLANLMISYKDLVPSWCLTCITEYAKNLKVKCSLIFFFICCPNTNVGKVQ